MPPEVLLLYRIVFPILGFFISHMKLSTVLSRSVKNFAKIMMGIALSLYSIFFVFVEVCFVTKHVVKF